MVAELKSREMPFITLRVGEHIPANVDVVITTENEADTIAWDGSHLVIYDDTVATVNRAIRAERKTEPSGAMIIGIDPGRRPGVAVMSDDMVIAVHQVSPTEVEPLVRKIEHDYRPASIVVRIGNGARLVTTQIINTLLQAGFKVRAGRRDRHDTSYRPGRAYEHGQGYYSGD